MDTFVQVSLNNTCAIHVIPSYPPRSEPCNLWELYLGNELYHFRLPATTPSSLTYPKITPIWIILPTLLAVGTVATSCNQSPQHSRYISLTYPPSIPHTDYPIWTILPTPLVVGTMATRCNQSQHSSSSYRRTELELLPVLPHQLA